MLLCLCRTRCNVVLELGKSYNLLSCGLELPNRFDVHINCIHLSINSVHCFRNAVKEPIMNIFLDYAFNTALGEVSSIFNREEREKIDGKQAFS